VDIFLPNEDEACRISGKTDAESAIEALAIPSPLWGHPGDSPCR
jgi:sugar/nucleoside kinase (ribokinase family)